MAIQFPNFLAAQTHAPDYSGIGDSVENFYKGYNMPKDALIKEIQAKFAQPNAEADLQSTQLKNAYQKILNQYAPSEKEQSLASGRLSNRKSQMDIDKVLLELQQQKALENQFRMALGGAPQGGGSPSSAPMMPNPPQSNPMPPMMPNAPMMPQGGGMTLPGMPKGLPMPPAIPGMTMIGSPPVGGAPLSGMPNTASAGMPSASPEGMTLSASNPAAAQPSLQQAAPEAPNEVVITKGSPQLAGIDAMYDSNPLSRAFLEKKGYKKTQEVKFDNKTGKTTVITKYPSGKVTVQSTPGAAPSEDGIPLTNKMISKHQNIISSIDNALPIIDQILDEGEKPQGLAKRWEPYPRDSWRGLGMIPGFQSQSTKYEALVSSALDSLIGAYGLPSTNEGIDTVKKQLLIGHGETDSHYRKRLKEIVKDLQRRKSYSASEVKKSNKITPVDSSAGGASDQDTYSSNEWEQV